MVEGPDHTITQDDHHELTGNVESLRRIPLVLLAANGLGEVEADPNPREAKGYFSDRPPTMRVVPTSSTFITSSP
jgi:hypothetical protein